MPRTISIGELQNTDAIAQMCRESTEPIFISQNGRRDMVVMSMETYERQMTLADIEEKLAMAAEDVEKGRVVLARDSVKKLREKYGLYGV
ncbi:MAG: type II toxin-antitoxin system Phd/YefM family antitoxin [Angelakisella sp.]|jgi:PHD/YefM family antitoxin component YafN of YafNO toxin-antitoxin module|nr:type II toxin-antitoxin system Phd/YefM family antitoxin [Angelakisella sp.]